MRQIKTKIKNIIEVLKLDGFNFFANLFFLIKLSIRTSYEKL